MINLDIESFFDNLIELAPSREPDVFATEFEAWPEFLPILRMPLLHPLNFDMFIPQMHGTEAWLKKHRELADTDIGKFWCHDDWVDDAPVFTSARISNAVADVVARQSAAQEWDPKDSDDW